MALFVLLLMFFLVLINVPIAFTLCIASILGFLMTSGTASLNTVPIILFDGVNSFPLMAVPLFILMGEIMNGTKLSRQIINLAVSMVGFIRGGLAMVTIVASMFFAELSGSAVAGAAALGSVLIPQMTEKGYPRDYAAAVLSSAATIAIIIPPSAPLILYGVITGQSISKLFIAGFIPGILCGLGLMVVAYILACKENLPRETSFSARNFLKALKEGYMALLIPVIVLGGIFTGIFTPTEAAAIACMVAFVAGIRDIKLKDLPRMLTKTAHQTAIVTLIVAGSAILAWFLTAEQIPQSIAAWVISLTQNKYVILIMLNVLLLFLGTILHSSAAILMSSVQ